MYSFPVGFSNSTKSQDSSRLTPDQQRAVQRQLTPRRVASPFDSLLSAHNTVVGGTHPQGTSSLLHDLSDTNLDFYVHQDPAVDVGRYELGPSVSAPANPRPLVQPDLSQVNLTTDLTELELYEMEYGNSTQTGGEDYHSTPPRTPGDPVDYPVTPKTVKTMPAAKHSATFTTPQSVPKKALTSKPQPKYGIGVGKKIHKDAPTEDTVSSDDDDDDDEDLSSAEIMKIVKKMKTTNVVKIDTAGWMECADQLAEITVFTRKRVRVLYECITLVRNKIYSGGSGACDDVEESFDRLCRDYNNGTRKAVNFTLLFARAKASKRKELSEIIGEVDALDSRVRWICTQLLCVLYHARSRSYALIKELNKMTSLQNHEDHQYLEMFVDCLAVSYTNNTKKSYGIHKGDRYESAATSDTAVDNSNGASCSMDFDKGTPSKVRRLNEVDDGNETDASQSSVSSCASSLASSVAGARYVLQGHNNRSPGIDRIVNSGNGNAAYNVPSTPPRYEPTPKRSRSILKKPPSVKRSSVEQYYQEIGEKRTDGGVYNMVPMNEAFRLRCVEATEMELDLKMDANCFEVHRHTLAYVAGKGEKDRWFLTLRFTPHIGLSYNEVVRELLNSPDPRVSGERVHALLKNRLVNNTLGESVKEDLVIKQRLQEMGNKETGKTRDWLQNVDFHLDRLNTINMDEMFSVPWKVVQDWSVLLASKLEKIVNDGDATTGQQIASVLDDYVDQNFNCMKEVFDIVSRISEPCLYILFGLDKSMCSAKSLTATLSRQVAYLVTQKSTLQNMIDSAGLAEMRRLMWCVPLAYLLRSSGVAKRAEPIEVSNDVYMDDIDSGLTQWRSH